MFVTFEGPDGVGKTSHAKSLSSEFGAVFSREPTSVLAKQIRDTIKLVDATWNEIALLFAADRVVHCNKIAKKLFNDKLVFCDRYVLSSLAYQADHRYLIQPAALAPLRSLRFHTTQEQMRWIFELNRFAIVPHLTFLMMAPLEVCLARCQERNVEDKSKQIREFETRARLSRVIENYQMLAENQRLCQLFNIVVINTDLPKDQVFGNLTEHIKAHLELDRRHIIGRIGEVASDKIFPTMR